MKCEICGRSNLTARELAVHRKLFHNEQPQQISPMSAKVCPDCGAALVLQEGCEYCSICGYSKCG